MITKVRKLAEQNPEEVRILRQPETNDGCIYAKMPYSYLHLHKKKTMNLTDEQRKAAADRMRALGLV